MLFTCILAKFKDLLHISNIYSSCVSGVEYNLNQIVEYLISELVGIKTNFA